MSDTKAKRPALRPRSKATIGEKYGYAMEITDEAEARDYFEACVKHNMSFGEHGRAEAERVEKANIGYYAGYYDNETRQRVERLFNCAHPVFGKATETPVDAGKALLTGMVAATHGLDDASRIGR